MRRQSVVRGVLGFALLLAAAVTASAQQLPGRLFVQPPGAATLDMANQPGVMQTRYVGLNPQVLSDAAPGISFVVDLFTSDLHAVIDRVERPGADTQAIIGRLVGLDGSIILVTTDGVSAGSIVVGDTKYQIRYAGNGVYALREFDSAYLPEELHAIPVYPAEGDPAPAPSDPAPTDTPPLGAQGDAAVAADSGARFDLAVFWTAQARTAVGGAAAMRALINLGVTETNQAYANSGIIPRLRLVHMSEVAYTESGSMSTDLSRLRSTNDGHMDGVHALRNTHGADMVKLITNSGGGCGIAYLMAGVSASFESSAFSVTHQSCVSPNYTFAHELGHNMGSNHAPDDPVGTGAFSYSFGYKKTTSPRFRTIMAYVDNCPSPCPRVLHFSNPARNYVISGVGYPTGTASQDNARSINNVRTTVANWRQEVPLVAVTSLYTVTQPNGTAPQGGKVARLWGLVRNNGPNPLAAGQRLWFWVETSTGTSGSWVGSADISGLAPGASQWYSFDWSVPITHSGNWRYYGRTWHGAEATSNTTGPVNFSITAAPAVSAEVVSLASVSGAKAGQTSTLWAQVRNNGLNAHPSGTNVWFQVTFPGGSTAWVGSASSQGLASGQTGWYSIQWTIPFSPGAGSYQYRASVWTGSLISNIGGPQSFTVAAADATAAEVVSIWPVTHPSPMPGSTLTLWGRVRNAGTAALPAGTRLWFRAGSVWVGGTLVEGLAPNAEQWYSVNWTIPLTFVGGTHALSAQVWTGVAISPFRSGQPFMTGFSSQFNGSNAPWLSVSGTWTNDQNAFLYTAGVASTWSSTSYTTSFFSNVDYEARFWRNGEALATCLIARGTPGTLTSDGQWASGYFFCYARDGRYWIFKRVSGTTTFLQGFTNSHIINQGSAWNALRATLVGNQLAFYINGFHVWSGTDGSLTGGRAAITQYGTGPLWVDWAVLRPVTTVSDAAVADTISEEQRIQNALAVPGDPSGR
jgi:peptidyl-Asp metalloendopeptidase